MKIEHDHRKEPTDHFVLQRYKVQALDTDAAWKRLTSGQPIRRFLPLRRYLTGAAAIILLLVGISTFYYIEKSKPQWIAVTTTDGQVVDVCLPDSTWVSLSAGSQLQYDKKQYGKESRTVKMKGRAFFQVMRDGAHPFFVVTEHTKVQVLGTSFQVYEQKQSTEVYVLTGRVTFSSEQAGEVLLTAGMTAIYSSGSRQIHVQEEEKPNVLSWKTNELHFQDTPLEEVMQDLSSHYQVSVINRTVASEELKLTATFSDMPLEEVLFIINQTLDTDLAVR